MPARNDPFDDDSITRFHRSAGIARDRALPLVTQHDGVLDELLIDPAVDDLEVGAADTRDDRPDQDLVLAGRGLVSVLDTHLSGFEHGQREAHACAPSPLWEMSE